MIEHRTNSTTFTFQFLVIKRNIVWCKLACPIISLIKSELWLAIDNRERFWLAIKIAVHVPDRSRASNGWTPALHSLFCIVVFLTPWESCFKYFTRNAEASWMLRSLSRILYRKEESTSCHRAKWRAHNTRWTGKLPQSDRNSKGIILPALWKPSWQSF